MDCFQINNKKIKRMFFVLSLNTTICFAIIFWLCSGPLFESGDTILQKIFMVGLSLTLIFMCLWFVFIFVIGGIKEFFMLGLKIGFEEDRIVILNKDSKYKISMSDLIAICDDGTSFRIIFYYQSKLFTFEIIRKYFPPALTETINETFSSFAGFTKSRSIFKDILKEHEAKSLSKARGFEFLLGNWVKKNRVGF